LGISNTDNTLISLHWTSVDFFFY